MVYLHKITKTVFYLTVLSFVFFLFFSCKSTTKINKRNDLQCEDLNAFELLSKGDFELLSESVVDPKKVFLSSKVGLVTGSTVHEARQCSKLIKLKLDFSKAQDVDFVLERDLHV